MVVGVGVGFRDEGRGRVFRDGIGIRIQGRVHGRGRVSRWELVSAYGTGVGRGRVFGGVRDRVLGSGSGFRTSVRVRFRAGVLGLGLGFRDKVVWGWGLEWGFKVGVGFRFKTGVWFQGWGWVLGPGE
ncbi:hypothetical protein TIFTF001_051833 [Ficus carica]|uniref:Uncharacterized protein n=1 Tax=Ficus carica TaxID=3494 RepID=A0AA88EBG0_FICCA|nr:hypothetical protein TIFTF001_051833 [Ficus carica]